MTVRMVYEDGLNAVYATVEDALAQAVVDEQGARRVVQIEDAATAEKVAGRAEINAAKKAGA